MEVSDEAIPAALREYNVGENVYAMFYADSLYYKAVILDRSGETYKVLFTEYGNTQETRAIDIYDEATALALAAQTIPEEIPKVQCTECGNWDSLEYCGECGTKLRRGIQETAEERAARLVLELTPWGDCKGCGGTIMLSDPECLVCGLPRGAEKRASRASQVLEAKSLETSGTEETQSGGTPTTTKKATLLSKLRGSGGRSSTDSSEPSSPPPAAGAVAATTTTAEEPVTSPRKMSIMDRFKSSKKEEPKKEDGEDAASPRKKDQQKKEEKNQPKKEDSPGDATSPRRGVLLGRLLQSKKEDKAEDKKDTKKDAEKPGKMSSLLDKIKQKPKEGLELKPQRKIQPKPKPKDENSSVKVQESASKPQVVEKKSLQQEPSVTTVVLAGSQNLQSAPPVPPKPKTGSTLKSPPVPPKPKRPTDATKPKVQEEQPKVEKPSLEVEQPAVSCCVCKGRIVAGDPVCLVGNNGADQAHAHCWKCLYCGKGLKKFYRIEDAQVCEECFVEKKVASRLVCSVCKKPVTEYYRVGNAILCQKDYEETESASKLKCDVCKKPLSSYYSHEGKILCESDYQAAAWKKCDVCKAVLKKYYVLKDGRNVCEEDYKKTLAKCTVCGQACDAYTKVDGKIYCDKDRPKCCKCHGVLSSYIDRDGAFYCVPCSKKYPAQPTKVTTGQTNSRFCSNCGFEVSPGARFCGGCGKPRNP